MTRGADIIAAIILLALAIAIIVYLLRIGQKIQFIWMDYSYAKWRNVKTPYA